MTNNEQQQFQELQARIAELEARPDPTPHLTLLEDRVTALESTDPDDHIGPNTHKINEKGEVE